MKKIFLYIAVAALGLAGLNGCNDFGDMNVDPEHLSEEGLINSSYNMVFTMTQVQALGSDWDVWRNGIIYGSTMLQHTTSVDWSYVFYTYDEAYNSAFWDVYCSDNRGVVREIIKIVNKWEGQEEFKNDYQIARIMKAYIFHRMTDLYGDIPYSEAGRITDVLYPKYDTQKAIYDDLLKELDEAQAAISGSSSQLGSADLYYGGDASKWKKFANSLMLRVAMRLSKVDENTAKTWAAKALANGVITSTDENAMLRHTDGIATNDSAEPYGKIFSESNPDAFFISETFMNMLTGANDPRIALIGTVCTDPGKGYTNSAYEKGNPDPTVQKGMPVGYNLAGGQWDLSLASGYPGGNFKSVYSVPSRYTYADPAKGVTMIVTHAETQLLLAEAHVRGWITAGSAEDYYNAGIRAAMEQFKFYSGATELYAQYLTPAAVDTYVTANALTGSNENKYKQINTQYYITTFCDEYESFANWRRSGYPELTPVNKAYPDCVTNGTIPRRFTYPSGEAQSNPANYLEAVRRLSDGDRMTSRVWWDKE
ncbi:MAG: SusD/RagB family nutrient-binding outer membrane lipoprotein [Prevotellaceae bacterium]|jgi:hypothetical protein|nr:SusD/RagB family nutrient-binding outer membrane lipoprotein [Prevotellaceae bacterium]